MRCAVRNLMVTLLSTAWLSPSAQAVLIDDFSVGALSIVRGASAVVQSQTGLDPAHVVGGARHLRVGYDGTTGQSATIDTLTKNFQFVSGVTSNGYLEVSYGTATAPLNLDLTSGGATHLEVVFQNVGVSPNSINKPPTLWFISRSNATRMPLGGYSAVPLGDGRYRSLAAFSANPAIDFEDIDTVTFSVGRYPTTGVLTVYSIQSVFIPEPASWLLATGAGLLSIAARRR